MSLNRTDVALSFDDFVSSVCSASEMLPVALTGMHFSAGCWGLGKIEPTGLGADWFGREATGDIYESRVFGSGMDARWVRRGSDGFVTCWTDTTLWPLKQLFGAISQSWPDFQVLERRYCLWGLVDSTSGQSASVSDARVGRMTVPATGHGRRVFLNSHEYLATVVDGNTTVLAECFQGFSIEE